MKKLQSLLKALIVLFITITCMYCITPITYATSASDYIKDIEANMSSPGEANNDLLAVVNNFLGLMQILSAFAAVVVIVWCGFSYILGTPEGKAEIKKNMIPLIVGVVVVFAASSIARLIFGLMG